MPDNVIKYIQTPDGTTYDVRDDSKIETALKGAVNGVAELGSTGKVPNSQLPNMTGATSIANGTSGLVPAPESGDETKVLMGDGTWSESPGAKLLEVVLTPLSNVSGAYSGTTSDSRITEDMKCIMLEIGTPSVFKSGITVVTGNGTITLSCSDVSGSSTVKATLQKVIEDPTAITSTEYDLLNNAISNLRTDSVAKKAEIPANSNANDYKENGVYTIGATNSTSISNLATTGASELVVFTSSAYTVQTQYIVGDGNDPIIPYQRYFRNNIWSGWKRLALHDQIANIETHGVTVSSATSWDAAIEGYIDSLPNADKCHIGFVQRSGLGIVMCIIQKYVSGDYASAIAYGYWREPYFYRKDNGTWTSKHFTTDDQIAEIGTVLSAAWTATSSSAALTKLTNSINLTKGTWLVIVTVPVVTSGSPLATIGPAISTIDNNQFGLAPSAGGQTMRIVSVSTTQEIYAMAASSAAVSYDSNYLVRGGIKAVKIGL